MVKYSNHLVAFSQSLAFYLLSPPQAALMAALLPGHLSAEADTFLASAVHVISSLTDSNCFVLSCLLDQLIVQQIQHVTTVSYSDSSFGFLDSESAFVLCFPGLCFISKFSSWIHITHLANFAEG